MSEDFQSGKIKKNLAAAPSTEEIVDKRENLPLTFKKKRLKKKKSTCQSKLTSYRFKRFNLDHRKQTIKTGGLEPPVLMTIQIFNLPMRLCMNTNLSEMCFVKLSPFFFLLTSKELCSL